MAVIRIDCDPESFSTRIRTEDKVFKVSDQDMEEHPPAKIAADAAEALGLGMDLQRELALQIAIRSRRANQYDFDTIDLRTRQQNEMIAAAANHRGTYDDVRDAVTRQLSITGSATTNTSFSKAFTKARVQEAAQAMQVAANATSNRTYASAAQALAPGLQQLFNKTYGQYPNSPFEEDPPPPKTKSPSDSIRADIAKQSVESPNLIDPHRLARVTARAIFEMVDEDLFDELEITSPRQKEAFNKVFNKLMSKI
jgi:hypothetical protein